MPIDIQLVINLSEPKPLLPTTFNTIIEGINSLGEAIELFNGNVTQSTLSQTFTFNAMNPGYSTYRMKLTNADMIEANGATQQKTNSQLSASNNQFTFDLAADQFKNPGDFDGPTKLFIQFSCVPSSGNPLSMDSPYLPGNFHLIVSGTGFDGETVLQVQDGSLIFPFNPVLQDGGVWQVKVIMGDLEFPAGDSRVTIPSTFFQLIDGKVVFGYSLESTSQCDEFKRALGLD
jgi:hypothetical protein